ncbi:hypothetical protein BGZ58_002123 [Dissophora ornata]|nr:hypothetical protein BGZ58_002123 [Dissophora ornata]
MGALQCGWLGANLAISFLEAPIKFLAPTPARRSLIDVGRHVFSAFNKVEVILAAFDLLGWYLLTQRSLVAPLPTSAAPGLLGQLKMGWRQWLRFSPGLIVFVFESFTFLPVMRGVGARFIEGQPVEKNNRAHVVYVALEAIKVATLAASTASIGQALLQLI